MELEPRKMNEATISTVNKTLLRRRVDRTEFMEDSTAQEAFASTTMKGAISNVSTKSERTSNTMSCTCKVCVQSTSGEKIDNKRRAGRRKCRSLRPDSSGMINNRDCHILAFSAQIEEMIAME